MTGEHLIVLARRYAEYRGLSVASVSTYMGGSGDTLARLERGHDMTTRRLQRFLQWFSDHWPDGELDWPLDITRPLARKDAA